MNKRINYSEEFKQDAVTQLITSGQTIVEVASSLGISKSILGKWKNDYGSVASKHELSKDEKIRKLQIENINLRKDNEILKKSVSIFSRAQK